MDRLQGHRCQTSQCAPVVGFVFITLATWWIAIFQIINICDRFDLFSSLISWSERRRRMKPAAKCNIPFRNGSHFSHEGRQVLDLCICVQRTLALSCKNASLLANFDVRECGGTFFSFLCTVLYISSALISWPDVSLIFLDVNIKFIFTNHLADWVFF